MLTQEKETKKLITGVMSLTISSFIVKLLGLIYKLPLSYMLTDEGMGYFNSAYTVYTFFFIVCTAGAPKIMSVIIAEAEARHESDIGEAIYKKIFRAFLVFGIVLSIIFVLSARMISDLIGNSGAYLSMLGVAPSIPFICAAGIIRGYFNGRMSFIPIAISEIISGLSRVIFGIILCIVSLKMGFGIVATSAFTITGSTLGAFLGFVYLKSVKNKQLTHNNTRQKTLFSHEYKISFFIKSAVPLTLTGILGSLGAIIDLGIIMNNLKKTGLSEFQADIIYGNYTTLAIPMLNLVGSFLMPICAALLPSLAMQSVKEDKKELAQRLNKLYEVILIFIIPISLLFLLRAEDILMFLFDDTSARLSAPMLTILAPGIFFMCLSTVTNTALESQGNTYAPLVSLLISTITKLGLTYYLTSRSEISVIGAPIATAVAYFTGFVISLFYLKKYVDNDLRILKSIFIPTAYSFAAHVISALAFNTVSLNQSLAFILKMLVFGAIYSIVFLKYLPKSKKALQKLSKCTKS